MSDLRYYQLLQEAQLEMPRLRVVAKETSRLMRLLARLLKPINPRFLSDYTTIIGYVIYMPADLIGKPAGYRTLVHEIVHARQYRRWGILFFAGYLFALPAVWTLRARWEMEAYAATIQQEVEERHSYGVRAKLSDARLAMIAQQFTGPAYCWMRPFPRRVMADLRRINHEAAERVRT